MDDKEGIEQMKEMGRVVAKISQALCGFDTKPGHNEFDVLGEVKTHWESKTGPNCKRLVDTHLGLTNREDRIASWAKLSRIYTSIMEELNRTYTMALLSSAFI